MKITANDRELSGPAVIYYSTGVLSNLQLNS